MGICLVFVVLASVSLMDSKSLVLALTDMTDDGKMLRQQVDDIPSDVHESDKRHLGRWRNMNYRLKGKRNDIGDIEDEKRFLGRWRNFNWMNKQKSAYGAIQNKRTEEEYGYILNDSPPDEKRNIGRWRNSNFKFGKLIRSTPELDKRFLGRWRNMNYKYGGMKMRHRNYGHGKRNYGL